MGKIRLKEAYGQEAAGGMNDAFGGISGGLRSILDFISNLDVAFGETMSWLKGTFLGQWDLIFGVLNG